MSIGHQLSPGNGAFVFAELGGFTCSICAPNEMVVGDVIKFAEQKFPSDDGERWVSVDKSKFGMGTPTPNPCNHNPAERTHWFMMRGTT